LERVLVFLMTIQKFIYLILIQTKE